MSTIIKIADKETLDSVESKVTEIQTDVEKIGSDNDEGSASGTTLFAKLKYAISWLTGARGSKVDSIGETGDTGASTSAGTVMGKLNNVIGQMNQSPSSYAIDNVNNVVNYTTATTIAAGESKRITSFKPTKSISYQGYLLGTDSDGSGYNGVRVFVSTISTNGATASTLEANNVYDSGTLRNTVTTGVYIKTSALTANTNYYIHVVCPQTGSNTTGYTVSKIYISSSEYNTTTQYPTIIKSIQRGFGSGAININKVNPQKCLVTINDMATESYSGYGTRWELAPDYLFLYLNTSTTGYAPHEGYQIGRSVQWEITEFY